MIYFWFAILCLFYGIKINQKKQCEKIGDDEKVKKIKRQMIWFFPLSIVIVILLEALLTLIWG